MLNAMMTINSSLLGLSPPNFLRGVKQPIDGAAKVMAG